MVLPLRFKQKSAFLSFLFQQLQFADQSKLFAPQTAERLSMTTVDAPLSAFFDYYRNAPYWAINTQIPYPNPYSEKLLPTDSY
jgi:hypothetical protein